MKTPIDILESTEKTHTIVVIVLLVMFMLK